MLQKSPKLAEMYARRLREFPGTITNPWRVVIGFDEFYPGRKMDYDANKKVMCLYLTFFEESTHWYCPCVARHNEILKIEGGWSRMLAVILHRYFLGVNGLSIIGVSFTHGSHTYLFYGKLHILLSDGDGLKVATEWKGASSLKPE